MLGVKFLVAVPGFSAEVHKEGEKVLSVWIQGGMKAQIPVLIRTPGGTVCALGCIGL